MVRIGRTTIDDTVGSTVGSSLDVSDSEYNRMKSQVDSGQRDSLVRDVSAPRENVKLWDNIDNDWTRPLERNIAMNEHLVKVVLSCSACTYTQPVGIKPPDGKGFDQKWEDDDRGSLDLDRGAIKGHVEQARANGESHKNDQPCRQCQKDYGREDVFLGDHVKNTISLGEGHIGEVKELLMYRFTLGPSVPAVISENVVAGPDGTQVERRTAEDPAGSKSRRRRGRRRRGRK